MRVLPEKYKSFTLMVTHGLADMTLGEFKAKLRNFEASEDEDGRGGRHRTEGPNGTKEKDWASGDGVLAVRRKGPQKG